MKKLFIALLAFISIGFHACTEDSALTPNPAFDPTIEPGQRPPSANINGTMTATLDGQAWSAQVVSGSRINNFINLTGVAADSSSITITLFPDNGEGNYSLFNVADGNASYVLDNTGSQFGWTAVEDTNAVVVIADIDESRKIISGTFEFVLIRQSDSSQITVTSGQFRMNYTTTLTGGSGNNNTLSADVDGASFTASVVTGLVANTPGLPIQLVINGSDSAAGETIGLTLPENIAAGSYTIGSVGDSIVAQYNASISAFFGSETGNLVINNHDLSNNTIDGSFDFIGVNSMGTDSVTVNNGTFDVSY